MFLLQKLKKISKNSTGKNNKLWAPLHKLNLESSVGVHDFLSSKGEEKYLSKRLYLTKEI
jgi:hypothetical protein